MAKSKTVTVKLKKEHHHQGEKKDPGDEIEVTPSQAKWLQDRDIIETSGSKKGSDSGG